MNFNNLKNETITLYNLLPFKELCNDSNDIEYERYHEDLNNELSNLISRIKNIDIDLKYNFFDNYYKSLKETYIKLLRYSQFDHHKDLSEQFSKISSIFGQLVLVRELSHKNSTNFQNKLVKLFDEQIDKANIHIKSFYQLLKKQNLNKYIIDGKMRQMYTTTISNAEQIISQYIQDFNDYLELEFYEYSSKIVELIDEITIYLTKDNSIN